MHTNKNIEVGIPSREATDEALRNLSQFFSRSKVLRSNDHPELSVRGQRAEIQKADPDNHYRADRLDNVYDDDI